MSERQPVVLLRRPNEMAQRMDIDETFVQEVKAQLPDMNRFSKLTKPRIETFIPLTFQDLKAHQLELQTYDLSIPRKIETDDQYRQHRERLKNDTITMADRIRMTRLQGRDKAITFDEFPYNIPEDTLHFNLWFENKHTSDDEIAMYLAQFLYMYGLNYQDLVVIEKPPEDKRHSDFQPSVPEIRHAHVFIHLTFEEFIRRTGEIVMKYEDKKY